VNVRGNGNLPGAFSPVNLGGGIAKHYISPGDDLLGLLMRTRFTDERKKDAAIRWLHRLEKYHQVEHKRMLLNLLAANVAVSGERVKELTDVMTGRDRDHKNAKGGQFFQPYPGQAPPEN